MYEAFVYVWKNIESGKCYVGFHLGDEDDTYVSSSTSEEFRLHHQMGLLERTIIDRGSEDAMRRLEREHYEELKAQGVALYNQATPGASLGYKNNPLQKLKEEYESGSMVSIDSYVADVLPLLKRPFQVRKDNLDFGKIADIAELMRVDPVSARKNVEPIFIVRNFKDSDGSERDVIINGNHTIRACEKAGWVTVPIIKVDFGKKTGLTSRSAMMSLGNFLNRNPDGTLIEFAKYDDMVNQVVEAINDGEDVESKAYKEMLRFDLPHLAAKVGKAVKDALIATGKVRPGEIIINVPGKGQVDEEGNPKPQQIRAVNFKQYTDAEKAAEIARYECGDTAAVTWESKSLYQGIGAIVMKMAKEGKSMGIIIPFAANVKTINAGNAYAVQQAIDKAGLRVRIMRELPAYCEVGSTEAFYL